MSESFTMANVATFPARAALLLRRNLRFAGPESPERSP